MRARRSGAALIDAAILLPAWGPIIWVLADSGLLILVTDVDVATGAAIALAAPPLAQFGGSGIAVLFFVLWWFLLVTVPVFCTYGPVLTSRSGQTVGKRLAGLRVVTPAGEPVGFWRAFLREAALKAGLFVVLSWPLVFLPLALDLAVGLIRRDGRALHDVMAGTRVVAAA